jgi:hypothetical protein
VRDGIRRGLIVALVLAAAAGLAGPGVVRAAGGPAPAEPCVPGTVWEDLASGVKYLCIYDEIYGGPRWVLMRTGQVGDEAFLSRSTTYGCTLGSVGLTSIGGSGADAIVRSYRWPCATPADRTYQPTGELRVRVLIQRYSTGWSTCRDSGYAYNTTTSRGWLVGIDMGSLADCGSGSYRAWGFGAIYQGGAWRGSSIPSLALVLR